jgi:regulator of sirC expression with transglutaminase-like and TPR domain
MARELNELPDGISRAKWEAEKNNFAGMEFSDLESFLWEKEPEEHNRQILFDLAKQHEIRAQRLHRLANQAHHRWVRERLARLFQQPESEIDLMKAALYVALADNPDLDVEHYLNSVDAMAAEVRSQFEDEWTVDEKLHRIRDYLFAQNGFHGSRLDYYNRSNSHMNDVLDYREGLPITLSLLHMELARRCGVPRVEGVGLPGHFIVRERRDEGSPVLIDVFKGGKEMSLEEARQLTFEYTGQTSVEPYLEPVSKRNIIVRMLRNLLNVLPPDAAPEEALEYQNLILALQPESIADRLNRIRVRVQSDRPEEAREDLEFLIETQSPELDIDQLKVWLNTLPE